MTWCQPSGTILGSSLGDEGCRGLFIIPFNLNGINSYGIGGSSRFLLAEAHGNSGGALGDLGPPALLSENVLGPPLPPRLFAMPARTPLALPSPPPRKRRSLRLVPKQPGRRAAWFTAFSCWCPLCGNAAVSPGREALSPSACLGFS